MIPKPSVLYLVHRIPYPPNKGDKIRSYNVLRFLAERYRVHLGTFVDDDADWKYTAALEKHCEDICAVELKPRTEKVRSLTALLRGEAMSVPYYRNRELAAWVDRKIHGEGLSRVVVFSSPMAQYVRRNGTTLNTVVDFVDVDSEKWLQYAERHAWPMSWLYRREAAHLLEFEKRVASAATASVFVTAEEARLFRRRAGDVTTPVHSIVNGVDTQYFSPEQSCENPFPSLVQVIVFTGMMDYWANVDAVSWFAREIFPQIRSSIPEARFYIVGARPTRTVEDLSKLPGVEVTGAVPDIRPYLAHANVAVAPMRVARGIQNKVLEAFAMETPVVVTSDAVEGLNLPSDVRRYVDDGPNGIADKIVDLLTDGATARSAGERARRWVTRHHDWRETLKPMERLIEGS